MAKPKKRAYSLIDSYGESYNLARMVRTAKTAELRAFFKPIEQELIDQDAYQQAIRQANEERIAKETAEIDARYAKKKSDLYRWTMKRANQVSKAEAKQAYWTNYRETAKTLAEEKAQALADWEAKRRVEKIRQLEEEWIRREMERKREQERGRSRGLSL